MLVSLNDLLMEIWDICNLSQTTSVPPWLTNGQPFPTNTQVNSMETLKEVTGCQLAGFKCGSGLLSHAGNLTLSMMTVI